MRGRSSITESLTNVSPRQAALLTLTMLMLMTSHLSHADSLPPAEAAIAKQRVSEVTTYIRKQSVQGMSLLPGEARQVLGWFSGGWHQVQMNDDTTEPQGGDAAPAQQAISEQSQAPRVQTFGLASNFHHKGFLPMHDAMVMGFTMKKNVFEDKLAFTARPYYGQNWHSLRSYWGTELALNIDQREDGMPWGKIALGYIGGDESLTDHGRGIELHGDIDLTNHFKFTSGVRQNSADGNSNYMLIRWQLKFQ